MAALILNPNKANMQYFLLSSEPFIIGTSEDCNIRLEGESISGRHTKIERRGDQFSVVDLKSQNGTFLNGTVVEEAFLENGDVIGLGEVEILFVEEADEEQREGREKLLPAVIDRGMVRGGRVECPNCGNQTDETVAFCPHCGWRLGRGELLSAEAFLAPVERTMARRGAGILPMVSLIMGIFGPLIFGIGWLLAIILGFISLSIIRKRGGLISDRRKALWGINLGLTWAVLGCAVGGILFYRQHLEDTRARIVTQIAENETAVLGDLRDIALTEEFVKSGFIFDRDGDGISEYGKFTDLAEVKFPYYSKERFQTGKNRGYLFSIHTAGEETLLCEAVPLKYETTGIRTFSIGEDGYLRGGDTGGRSVHLQKVLPALSDEPVYAEFDEEIACNLLNLAET